jgi:hypothetical protein
MNRHSLVLSALVALLISGCASTPVAAPALAVTTASSTLPTALGCVQLEGQIARAEEARRVADEKGQNAWKAVVPFAVAARYVSGKTAAAEAQEALDGLRTQSAQLGCAGHGG